MIHLTNGPNDVVLTLGERRTGALTTVIFEIVSAAGERKFFQAPATESNNRFDAYTWTLVDEGDEEVEAGRIHLKPGTYTYRAWEDEISIPQTLVLDGHEVLLEQGRAVVSAADAPTAYSPAPVPGVFYRPEN